VPDLVVYRPTSGTSKNPIRTPSDIMKGDTIKGIPRDLRRVPSSKVDGKMGAEGGATVRLAEYSGSALSQGEQR